MRYIIMCGGTYHSWEWPRQLTDINGESVVARTIRLLRENGVTDIAISSNNPIFEQFGIPVLEHENHYEAIGSRITGGDWFEAFYPTTEPTCYIFGDVVFSPEAIKTIVETDTDTIEFFASAPPFAPEYPKPWAEPFALKVQNTDWLWDGIEIVRRLQADGVYWRKPIMWELWSAITDFDPNLIDFTSYTAINDYTCDIDYAEDIQKIINFVV